MKERTHAGEYPAQQNCQSLQSAVTYRAARNRSHYHRYYHEDAIVNHWLDELPERALILDVTCSTGRFVKTIINRHLGYLDGNKCASMDWFALLRKR